MKALKLIAVAGVLAAAIAFARPPPTIDNADRWVKGNLQVTGVVDAGSLKVAAGANIAGITTVTALDAGQQSKVSGVLIGGLTSQDGGIGQSKFCQFGWGPGTSGVLAVTYTTAFSSAPQCQCTHVGTTNTNGCVLTTGATPTTTAASFTVASGGTDVIDWLCCGDI